MGWRFGICIGLPNGDHFPVLRKVLPCMRTLLFLGSVRPLLIAGAAAFAGVRSPPAPRTRVKLGLSRPCRASRRSRARRSCAGCRIAIDEINAKGGLLGKKVELIVRDDESNPAKGAVAARELVQREKVAALFGGLDTPVSLAIVPFANQNKVPFMGVWAAGTPITRNGAAENYVFRVSAVDELVDKALVDYAIAKYQAQEARHDPDQQSLGRVERERA